MKYLVWTMIAACMLHACIPQAGYNISGELADADGMKLTLEKVTPDADPVRIDSCVVKKGKFRMKGRVEYPEYCLLYAGDNGPLQMFVENADINITLNLQNIQDSEVAGSEETDLLRDFYRSMFAFEDSAKRVNEEYLALKLSGETDTVKEKIQIDRMDAIRQQRIDFMKQFTEEHLNRMVSALIVNNNLARHLHPDELLMYANGFDAVNSKSPWVQNIREKADAANRLAIGQPFVDFNMLTPDGDEIALSDHAGKGKYVLIDFWASWCPPCRMANPHIVKLYSLYKDKDFEIVGVSLDRDKTEWTKAIDDDELTWVHMSDLKYWQNKGAKLYAVSSIPHTVLLDRDGTILDKGLDAGALEKKLAELLDTAEQD